MLDAILDSARKIDLVAGVLQGYVTVVAIAAGGAFAIYRLRIFRTLEPHITVTHTVSHRSIGDSYVHISVTANLHNASNVEVVIRQADYLLQQISPISDEGIEVQYSDAFGDDRPRYIRWPTLEDIARTWDENELIVEPRESHPETFEFVIARSVESVLIYTYFYNPHFMVMARSRTPEGWGATTVYDIIRR